MAYTGVVATEVELNAMAGENVDLTGWTEANKNAWMDQVEAFLCVLMRYNIVDAYTGLNEDVKRIFSEYAARYCAVQGIAYNMAGFTSRVEAENMINVHVYRMEKLEELLKDQKNVAFIQTA